MLSHFHIIGMRLRTPVRHDIGVGLIGLALLAVHSFVVLPVLQTLS